MDEHISESPIFVPQELKYPTNPTAPPVPDKNLDHQHLVASTDALYASISPLSMLVLQQLLHDHEALRYESPLYGYLNSIFSFIAPPSVGFQVGHQHALRPASSHLGYNPEHRRVGSDGLEHIIRFPGGGREIGVKYPDISFAKVTPHPSVRTLRTFAVLEIKISYIGDGSDEIANAAEDSRILDLTSQAAGYFLRVNKQPSALHHRGPGYVPVFVTFGKFYSQVHAEFDADRWMPRGLKPWQHIFEVRAGSRRSLFHALAEEVARYWHD
ncbi:hypothetical protein K438DRAFT_2032874 [Mycena galopus ATCC 62051]|nr:hypothetical protein K438DRAFT_2032874 [Mycena galopus ATCC 62051]